MWAFSHCSSPQTRVTLKAVSSVITSSSCFPFARYFEGNLTTLYQGPKLAICFLKPFVIAFQSPAFFYLFCFHYNLFDCLCCWLVYMNVQVYLGKGGLIPLSAGRETRPLYPHYPHKDWQVFADNSELWICRYLRQILSAGSKDPHSCEGKLMYNSLSIKRKQYVMNKETMEIDNE